MRRHASDLVARARLALTLLVGTVAAVLLPSSAVADSASTFVITTLAVAVAALVRVSAYAVTPSPCASMPSASAAELSLHRPTRVTDPVHHPIRPRAPGA